MLKKLFLIALPFLISTPSFAGNYHGGHSFSISNNGDSNNCEDAMRIWSDDYQSVARAEEDKSFANSALKIAASHNGGIQVHNWDQPNISIKVCKAVAARDQATAQRVLNEIRVVNDGTLTAQGPDNSDDYNWSTLFIVQAPKGATLDLSAYNGGISVKNASLNLTANTHNGGISLDHATGNINVQAQNGGISLKDCGGDVKVTVQNGGLDLQLAENWVGAGLQASTRNGGMVVQLPSHMKSGVEISTSQHTALICQDEACSGTERTWDDNRKIMRAGSGNTVIRASTENGGVVIKRRGASKI
jgi:DUF4097 and DUF4098 domain-containing protein YvlB